MCLQALCQVQRFLHQEMKFGMTSGSEWLSHLRVQVGFKLVSPFNVIIQLISPGGKVMVCAHRYTRRGLDYRWGQGQCFTLTNRLKFDETWEPCRGRDTYRWLEDVSGCGC